MIVQVLAGLPLKIVTSVITLLALLMSIKFFDKSIGQGSSILNHFGKTRID